MSEVIRQRIRQKTQRGILMGWKRGTVAKRAGMSDAQLSAFMNHRSNLSQPKLEALCSVLDLVLVPRELLGSKQRPEEWL